MTAQNSAKKINLLPQEEFASSTLGRSLAWAMSSFRVIVIVTEIIVMMAFLSRFWLDAKSNDLNDMIRQKQSVIASASNFESSFRETQKRLKIFSDISSESNKISANLEKISSYLPAEISLISYSYSKDNLEIKASSLNETDIAQFLANLENSKLFNDLALSNVGTSTQNNSIITFSLKFSLAKGGKTI